MSKKVTEIAEEEVSAESGQSQEEAAEALIAGVLDGTEQVPEPEVTEVLLEPGETEQDPDAELPKGLTADQKLALEKRFGKLTRLRREAETKQAEAESKLKESNTELIGRMSDMPAVLFAEDETQIAGREAALEDFAAKLEAWLDDAGPDDQFEEGEVAYSMADVKRTLRHARSELSKTIPKARSMLILREQANALARKLYPNVLKPDTEEGAEAKRMLTELPTLRTLPDWPLWVGRMISARKREPNAPAAPKPANHVPAAPGLGGFIPPRSAHDSRPASYDPKRVKASGYDEEVTIEEMAKAL